MTFEDIMRELENFGTEQTKTVLSRHGAREPFFGVKVQDLKKIVKKVKKNHELSMQLYDTGNSDAMYLAGLIADEKRISKETLQNWVEKAYWYMISEYTVPWVAAESRYGEELAAEWIESDLENIASAGWSTYSSVVSLKQDEELNLPYYRSLLARVEKTIHHAPNRVRYTMNGFVIAIGSYIQALSVEAERTADSIGKVEVLMGGTACRVPLASEYIKKVADKGRIGIKRKVARC